MDDLDSRGGEHGTGSPLSRGGGDRPDDDLLMLVGREARDDLSMILSGMGIDSQIEMSLREEQVMLNIVCGSDSNLVIGRKGQTLEALQLVTNRIASRKHPEICGPRKIVLDVEGYRERRRSNLLDMARRTADEVRETCEPVLLDPLNSYERYLVHHAIKEEKGVVADSRGEGSMKQILISPVDEGEE